MKAVNTVMKVLAALAAVAGTVYLVATYGDKIVAWAKNILKSLPCCEGCDEPVAEEEFEAEPAEIVEEVPAEEVVEEAPVEEVPAEEVPAEEPVIAEDAVVADEADFVAE